MFAKASRHGPDQVILEHGKRESFVFIGIRFRLYYSLIEDIKTLSVAM